MTGGHNDRTPFLSMDLDVSNPACAIHRPGGRSNSNFEMGPYSMTRSDAILIAVLVFGLIVLILFKA
jgi:hypothetical protein